MAYLYGARHLSPFEEIYTNARAAVTVSIGCWIAAFSTFVYSCFLFGAANVFFYYFAPLMVFMGWLVLTTFLHHQDIDAPWYAGSEWTYVKGNLSSIDRSYGLLFDNLVHSIGTHQIHHLFPKIPHYKLDRATAAFREAFPEFVRTSNESNVPAFFRNWMTFCQYSFAPEGQNYFCYRDVIEASQTNSKKIS
jgi:acyl-lipid omega-3 desaturase